MAVKSTLDRIFVLELVRVTEAAAIAAAKLVGMGDEKAADAAAVDSMRNEFNELPIQGRIVIGEGERDEAPMLYEGEVVGSGDGQAYGPKLDIAVDPVDGTTIVAEGTENAISVIALSESGQFLKAPDAWYMEKLAMGPQYDISKFSLDMSTAEIIHEAAKQKRLDKREDNVTAGVAELQRWLEDTVRQGLATQADDHHAWQRIAERMVDAQAPGLAAWLRRCADIRFQHESWQSILLSEVGRLYLLLQAWQRLDTLSPDLQDDIRQRIGFPVNKDNFTADTAISDVWQVVGIQQDETDDLNRQQTWLYGQGTQQFALLLDFAARGQVLPIYPTVGDLMAAQLIYYPGTLKMRASIFGQEGWARVDELPALPETNNTATDNLQDYAQALARLPWVTSFPFLLKGKAIKHNEIWHWQDTKGEALTLIAGDETLWQMLALTGGHEAGLFAEWDGAALRALSVWVDGKCQGLPGVNS